MRFMSQFFVAVKIAIIAEPAPTGLPPTRREALLPPLISYSCSGRNQNQSPNQSRNHAQPQPSGIADLCGGF